MPSLRCGKQNCCCLRQGSGAHHHIRAQQDRQSAADGSTGESKEALENVGLVVWQSAFVLAEFLMAHSPMGAWHDVRAVDLGTGTGKLKMPFILTVRPLVIFACL